MSDTTILKSIVKLADDEPGSLTVQVEDLEATIPDDELEVLEPVGIHFLPSLDEDMLVFEVNGSSDHRVVMGASQRGHRPQDLTAAGTGGLHYIGAWKVFLDDDGTLHLGERDAPDFVALKSLVDAEFVRIYDAIANMLFTPTPHDGGAALFTAIQSAFAAAASARQPTGSEVIKAI